MFVQPLVHWRTDAGVSHFTTQKISVIMSWYRPKSSQGQHASDSVGLAGPSAGVSSSVGVE